MDNDRNLLFGVLALQADLIDTRQFVEACTLWATRKDELPGGPAGRARLDPGRAIETTWTTSSSGSSERQGGDAWSRPRRACPTTSNARWPPWATRTCNGRWPGASARGWALRGARSTGWPILTSATG